jgi:hypothetical protein
MDRSKAEDRKLGEVKAVLQRLQQMSAEPTVVEPQVAEGGSGGPTRRMAVIAVLGAAALICLLVVSYTFVSVTQLASPRPNLVSAPPATSGTPRATPPKPIPTLEAAVGLMAAGRIQAARAALLRLAPEDSADAAWALARSYDPNYLATVPGADAGPDVEQATRWYRAWYAVAVKQGLVGDSVSLDRIIRSMR